MNDDAQGPVSPATPMRGALAPLLLVVAAGAALRLWNLGWGLPYELKIDETVYMGHALRIYETGKADPGGFKYSHLVTNQDLACVALVRRLAPPTGSLRSAPARVAFCADPSSYYLATRLCTTLVALATILLSFVYGRFLGGAAAGLAAGALLALHPVHIEQSKTGVPDVHLTFFVLATLYACHWAVRRERVAGVLLGSFCVGLAAAAKYNGGFAALAPALALLLVIRPVGLRRILVVGVAASLAAFAGYSLGNPYAVLHPRAMYIGLRWEMHIQSQPHFWQAPGSSLAEYAGLLGVELGLLGPLSLAWMWRVGEPVERRALVPVAVFVAFFVAFMSSAPVHFPRFILPAVPPLCIAAGWGVTRALARLRLPASARCALLACLVATIAARGFCETISCERARTRGDTRVLASRWAEGHLPEGVLVATEWSGLRCPSAAEIDGEGANPAQVESVLARFGGRRLRLERLPWSVAEHPLSYYQERGVEYLVGTDACREAVFRDPTLEEMQGNYRELEAGCEVLKRFQPLAADGNRLEGPGITVFHVPH